MVGWKRFPLACWHWLQGHIQSCYQTFNNLNHCYPWLCLIGGLFDWSMSPMHSLIASYMKTCSWSNRKDIMIPIIWHMYASSINLPIDWSRCLAPDRISFIIPCICSVLFALDLTLLCSCWKKSIVVFGF